MNKQTVLSAILTEVVLPSSVFSACSESCSHHGHLHSVTYCEESKQ